MSAEAGSATGWLRRPVRPGRHCTIAASALVGCALGPFRVRRRPRHAWRSAQPCRPSGRRPAAVPQASRAERGAGAAPLWHAPRHATRYIAVLAVAGGLPPMSLRAPPPPRAPCPHTGAPLVLAFGSSCAGNGMIGQHARCGVPCMPTSIPRGRSVLHVVRRRSRRHATECSSARAGSPSRRHASWCELPCPSTTPPHLPPWTIWRLRPLVCTMERRPSTRSACRLEPASGRPKVEDFPLSTTKARHCSAGWSTDTGAAYRRPRCPLRC